MMIIFASCLMRPSVVGKDGRDRGGRASNQESFESENKNERDKFQKKINEG